MSLFLAIMWTVCLICDIINCAAGNQPTWTAVFCPLIIVVMDRWIEYFKTKIK